MQAYRLLLTLSCRAPSCSEAAVGQDLWFNDRRWYSKKPVPMTDEEMAGTVQVGGTMTLPPDAAKIRAAMAENAKPKEKLSKTADSYKDRQKEKAKIRQVMLERSKKHQVGEAEKKQRRAQRLEEQKLAAQSAASVESDDEVGEEQRLEEAAFGNDASAEAKFTSNKRKMQKFVEDQPE